MHLDRLTLMLETVAAAGRPVSAADVQAATGLPRPTCYRLLQSLTDQRLLEEVEGGYVIGARLRRIAWLGLADTDVRAAAGPALKDRAIALGEAVFLARFRNDGVEIIHVETPEDPARSFVHPGLGFRPAHACSCSKAVAAHADPAFRNRILAGPMRAYTDKTRTSAESLRAEFDAIREKGYAECVEEIEVGVCSVAAPVQIGGGVAFSVGATGPIRRFDAAHRATMGAALIDLADAVGATLQISSAARA